MPKLKSITELKDEKKQLSARSKDVIEKAKTEKRQLSAEENELLGANQLRMREIDLEIEERMDENTSPGRPHVTRQGGFLLSRAIRNMVNGREQHETEAAIIHEATQYHRMSVSQVPDNQGIVIPVSLENRSAFTAATESATGVVIDQEQQEMLLPVTECACIGTCWCKIHDRSSGRYLLAFL